jgi:hypothetical protein
MSGGSATLSAAVAHVAITLIAPKTGVDAELAPPANATIPVTTPPVNTAACDEYAISFSFKF